MHVLAACSCASLIVGTGAGTAQAETDRELEMRSWVFSSALEVGVTGHSGKASMSGTSFVGPRDTIQLNSDGPNTIIGPEFDRGDVIAALVGADFEIMTPQFASTPLVPRFFMDLNVSAALTSEYAIVRTGNPGELKFPSVPSQLTAVGEELIQGTGASLSVQTQSPAVYAGIGAAFTVDFGESRLRIKPSLVYSRTRLEVSAIVKRAARLDRVNTSLASYRFIVLREDFSEVYHGIGPALELELDTDNRIGPFVMSIYLKAHANRIFGDLDTDLQAANPEYPGEIARWRYEQERWTYRAGTGIRFRLVPKK